MINGDVRQEEGVSDLLFNCAYLVSYLSSGTTLQKGSVIMTGTPGGKNVYLSRPRLTNWPFAGVGAGMKPAQYLKPGDVMEVAISSIGTLKNHVAFAW